MLDRLAPQHVEEAKHGCLTPEVGARDIPPDLLRSWQRSTVALGKPDNVRDVPHVPEEFLDAHLLDMLQAPLSRVSDDLAGTGLGLLLADAQGHILQRWSHDRSALDHLDQLGTVRGAVLNEEAVGTNGVGTVAATGKSVQISGEEHFADFYRGAVCTGAPVRHPMTGKLLGVVTISSGLSERSLLLRPLVSSVTMQLEQQVLDVEQPAARRMFLAFLDASRMQPGPVVAFGPDGLVMQSQKAGGLSVADVALIQQICAEQKRSGHFQADLSVGTAELQVRVLEDRAGVVVALDRARRPSTLSVGRAHPPLIGRAPEWMSAVQRVIRHRESRRPLLVAGEPGSGKASLALGTPFRPGAPGQSSIVADAAERHVIGSRRWLQQLCDRLNGPGPVVVRGIQTLDASSLDGLKSLTEKAAGRCPVALTVSADSLGDADALGSRLGVPVLWVPPLRERTGDLAALWRVFVEEFAAGAGMELRADALEVLKAYRWPGNVKELRGVVEQLATNGKRGPVVPGDLPDGMQGTRALSMIERVELEAIRKALQEADGNRSRAAEILGLSRATIYRKMKTYRLIA